MMPNNKAIEIVHLDDHMLFQKGVKMALHTKGKYLIKGFQHSDDALDHIESCFKKGRKIDVIVTDFNHLGLDGFVFALWAKTIAAHYSTHIPVILLSMNTPRDKSVLQGLDEDIFDCYLTKDSDASEIIAVIKNEMQFSNAINNLSGFKGLMKSPIIEFKDQLRYAISNLKKIKICGISHFSVFHEGEMNDYSGKYNSIVFDFGRNILDISGYISEKYFNYITDFYISDVQLTDDKIELKISKLKEIPATMEMLVIGNTIELRNINKKWKCCFAIYNHYPIKIGKSYFKYQ